MEYKMLLSPMNIGTMRVKNRVVMTAAEMSLGQTNGCPTEKMMDYYEERAKGGVGLIIPGICRGRKRRSCRCLRRLPGGWPSISPGRSRIFCRPWHRKARPFSRRSGLCWGRFPTVRPSATVNWPGGWRSGALPGGSPPGQWAAPWDGTRFRF